MIGFFVFSLCNSLHLFVSDHFCRTASSGAQARIRAAIPEEVLAGKLLSATGRRRMSAAAPRANLSATGRAVYGMWGGERAGAQQAERLARQSEVLLGRLEEQKNKAALRRMSQAESPPGGLQQQLQQRARRVSQYLRERQDGRRQRLRWE